MDIQVLPAEGVAHKWAEFARVSVQAHTKDSATPTPSASLPAPQKGIKNGSVVDATQRSVASELHMIMNGRSVHNAPVSYLSQPTE